VTECTQESFDFPPCQRRRVEAQFDGGDITSGGGVLLLQQVDRRLRLSRAIADVIDDSRRQASCQHDLLSLLRQRLYGLALGYEDLNDHQTLRNDLALLSWTLIFVGAWGIQLKLAVAVAMKLGSSILARWNFQSDSDFPTGRTLVCRRTFQQT
jgi:hypothetical protein